MKVRVQKMDSHLGRVVNTIFNSDSIQKEEHLECEGDVFVTQSFIGYDGERDMHRPHLRLIGEVKAIRGDFPHGITEASFGGDRRSCPRVEYRYNFTNQELSDLCKKGLFDKGFVCPDIFFENTFQLPMKCSCDAVLPETKKDAPLLFISVENQYNLETSYEESGYPIAAYFEEVKARVDEMVDDIEFSDMEDMDDILFKDDNALEPITEPVVAEKEITEEDILLAETFANIRDRVEDKLLQDENEKLSQAAITKESEDELEDELSGEIELDDGDFDKTNEFDEDAFVAEIADAVTNPDVTHEGEFIEDDVLGTISKVLGDVLRDLDDKDIWKELESDDMESADMTSDIEEKSETQDKKVVGTSIRQQIIEDMKRQIIEDNQELNEEKPVKKGVGSHKLVPSEMSDIADKDDKMSESEDEYI